MEKIAHSGRMLVTVHQHVGNVKDLSLRIALHVLNELFGTQMGYVNAYHTLKAMNAIPKCTEAAVILNATDALAQIPTNVFSV